MSGYTSLPIYNLYGYGISISSFLPYYGYIVTNQLSLVEGTSMTDPKWLVSISHISYAMSICIPGFAPGSSSDARAGGGHYRWSGV